MFRDWTRQTICEFDKYVLHVNFGPRWSADGEWLLFVSGVRGNSNPYVVRRNGTVCLDALFLP